MSSLFILTYVVTVESDYPEIRWQVRQSGEISSLFGAHSMALENREEEFLFTPLAVLITASGLQGVQPLVDRTM